MEGYSHVSLQNVSIIGIRASLKQNEHLKKSGVLTHRILRRYPIITSKHPHLDKPLPNKKYNLYPKNTIFVSEGRFNCEISLSKVENYVHKGIIAIHINSNLVFPDYVFQYLKWYRLKHTGRWSQQLLRDILIPILPKSKQHYVVNILSKIEGIIEKRNKVINLLAEYCNSQFNHLISKKNPFQSKSNMSKWITDVEVGSKLHSSDIPENTLVIKGKFNLSSEKQLSIKEQNEKSTVMSNKSFVFAEPGDLLWYRYNDKFNPEGTIIHKWEQPILISNDWIRIIPSHKVSTEFLAKYLENNFQNTKQMFYQKNVREIKQIILNLSIITPSKEEQQNINELINRTREIIDENRKSINKLESLYQAYCNKFFYLDKF